MVVLLKNKLLSACRQIKKELSTQINKTKYPLLDDSMDKETIVKTLVNYNVYLLLSYAYIAYSKIGYNINKFKNLHGYVQNYSVVFSCDNVRYTADIDIKEISMHYLNEVMNEYNNAVKDEIIDKIYDIYNKIKLKLKEKVDENIFSYTYENNELNEKVKSLKDLFKNDFTLKNLKTLYLLADEIENYTKYTNDVSAIVKIPFVCNGYNNWTMGRLDNPYVEADAKKYQISDDIKERIQMFSNLAYQMYTKIDIRNYRYILSNYLNDETREFLKKVIAIAKDNDILNDEMEVDISRAKLIIYVKLKLK